jgi:hypothetical protein
MEASEGRLTDEDWEWYVRVLALLWLITHRSE